MSTKYLISTLFLLVTTIGLPDTELPEHRENVLGLSKGEAGLCVECHGHSSNKGIPHLTRFKLLYQMNEFFKYVHFVFPGQRPV